MERRRKALSRDIAQLQRLSERPLNDYEEPRPSRPKKSLRKPRTRFSAFTAFFLLHVCVLIVRLDKEDDKDELDTEAVEAEAGKYTITLMNNHNIKTYLCFAFFVTLKWMMMMGVYYVTYGFNNLLLNLQVITK